MMAALRKGFLRIPGLSLDMYAKFYPNHAAQAFGHLDLTRQGQRSTRRKRYPLKSQVPIVNDSTDLVHSPYPDSKIYV
jgi:hypothetical protein